MNGKPTVPLAVGGLLMTGAGGTMVRVKVAVPVPPAFFAERVIVNVPASAGVPVICPVAGSRFNPGGKPVAL